MWLYYSSPELKKALVMSSLRVTLIFFCWIYNSWVQWKAEQSFRTNLCLNSSSAWWMSAPPSVFTEFLLAFAYCVFSAAEYLLLWIRRQVIGQWSRKHSECEPWTLLPPAFWCCHSQAPSQTDDWKAKCQTVRWLLSGNPPMFQKFSKLLWATPESIYTLCLYNIIRKIPKKFVQTTYS